MGTKRHSKFTSHNSLDLFQCGISTKRLSKQNLASILMLESKYITAPNICLKSSLDDIIKCLNSYCSFGLFVDGKLIAYSLAYYNEYGIGFIDKCFVLEEYRGKCFQKYLISRNIEWLIRCDCSKVFTMVSPENKVSEKNFNICGFSFLYQKAVGAYYRNILCNDIK